MTTGTTTTKTTRMTKKMRKMFVLEHHELEACDALK